jgi:ribosomal protein S19E (S16A)
VFDSLSERVATQLAQLKEVTSKEVADFLKTAATR